MDNTVLTVDLTPEFAPFLQLLEGTARRTTALHLTPRHDANPHLTGSRVRGPAFISPSYPWPTDGCGNPLFFLAQINLAELPESDGIPTSGLIQFFIADDGDMGLGGYMLDAEQWRGHLVRYIPADEFSNGHAETDSPAEDGVIDSCGYFDLHGQLYDQLPTSRAYEFIAHTRRHGFDFDTDDGLDLSELLDSQHHTIFGGGWIYLCEDLFQQTHHVPAPTDPHHPDSGYIVLFQLESYFGDHSDAAFMLADGGVARFYIHHDDLAALDFSKVIYECESS